MKTRFFPGCEFPTYERKVMREKKPVSTKQPLFFMVKGADGRNRPRAKERGGAAVANEITFQREAREVTGSWQWVAFTFVLLGLWLSGGLAPIDRKLPPLVYSLVGWLLELWILSGYFVGKFFEWICKRTVGKRWLVAISVVLVFPTWLVHKRMDQI